MNDWQVLRQIVYLARAAQWATSQPLFRPDSVVISAGVTEEMGRDLSMPALFVTTGDDTADEQEPGLLKVAFSLKLMTTVAGDGRGTSPLMGANRLAATAPGHGVLEIAVPLLAAIRRLNDSAGVRLQSVRSGGAGAQILSDKTYVGWKEYRLDVHCVDAKFFHPPLNLVSTPTGSGGVSHSWTLPAARFDYRRVILRRASGSTPPASATAGTGIPLGGSPDGVSATSVSETGVTPGTYSYSLFAAYNDYSVSAATGRDAPSADTTTAGDKDLSAKNARASVVVT